MTEAILNKKINNHLSKLNHKQKKGSADCRESICRIKKNLNYLLKNGLLNRKGWLIMKMM